MHGKGAARGIGFWIICLLVLCCSVTGWAQGEWSRLMVGQGVRLFSSVQLTPDGGVLLGGGVTTGTSGQSLPVLVRLDADGTLRWAQSLSAAGALSLGSLALAPDGGCLMVGSVKPPGASQQAGCAVRLGSDGQILWGRQYAGTGSLGFTSVDGTADGGWVITGSYRTWPGQGSSLPILKLNAAGTPLWKSALTGEVTAGWGQCVREAADGAIFVAGTRGGNQIPGAEPWLIKFSARGQVLWQKVFIGSGMDQPSAVAPTSDGGLVVAGMGRAVAWTPASAWAARLDAAGALKWQWFFGEPPSEYLFSDLREVPGDEFLLLGTKREPTNSLGRDWLSQMDGLGHLIWERTYEGGLGPSAGSLSPRPGGGAILVAAHVPSCGRLVGTRVAATGPTGGLPADCPALDDWPTEATAAPFSLTNVTFTPAALSLAVSDTAVAIGPMSVADWPLCPSTCSITCNASAPLYAQPGDLVHFDGTASASSCSGSPVFSWDFGEGSYAEGPTATHAYGYAGSYTWTFSVFADGRCCTQTGTILVRPCPEILLSPASLGGLVKGVACTKTVVASLGTAPYSFAVTAGTLPTGMTLSSTGVLSGAATGAGIWTFTITATDAQGCQGAKAYTLSVFDLFFDDDLGRCRFYVNRTTGAYQWDILAGAHAGESYFGTAVFVNGGTKIYSQPGAPNALNVTFDPIRKRAYGYFISATGVYSTFSDSNTNSTAGACQ